MKEKILSYFEIEKLNTTVKREVLAGFTTFISMAYILFVNPTVLGASGMDEGAVFTATALASAIGCILMGVLARYPIGTAPALGINAFFAYSVCLGMGIPWETALSGVFVASLIFILITIFKLREMIIDAIPADLKYAISGGIGLFIAFLGLSEGGIIVSRIRITQRWFYLVDDFWISRHGYLACSTCTRWHFHRDGSYNDFRSGHRFDSNAF